MRLKNKTVFATASGAGIGRASVLAMAREGARVYATDVDEAALDSLARESDNITTFVMDALDRDAIGRAVDRAGAPDVLFNCTGFVHHGTILDASDEDFDFSFNLNVKAHFRIIRAFLPAMLENGGGSIVNMASVASSIKGTVNRCVYSATKGAVIGLTKTVAADFIGRGIRCNAVCPGSVDTPSLRERMRARGDYEAARKAFVARAPMGRMATAEEVAELVVYLAGDESAFVTGQTHIIDGGWSL
ncbi:MAG: SDR family oxidoreductase [Arenicellales bacterium]